MLVAHTLANMREIVRDLINLAGFQASNAYEFVAQYPNDASALVQRIKETIKKDECIRSQSENF